MDPRLEAVDKILSEIPEPFDSERELGFAILAIDKNDSATLNWLAACAVAHANR